MSKCPFWSTGKKKVECYNECPMYAVKDEEECPFKEHLSSNKIDFKDIVEGNFAYSQGNDFDLEYVEETSNF